MALIIEDGTGIDGAQSYVSLATCSAYCTARAYSEWVGTDAVLEASILRAMSYIESFIYKGRKVSYDQALKWPRIEVYDEDNYLLPSDEIPGQLKNATCEAAYREIQNPGTLQADLSVGVKREKVDVLETEYFQGRPAQTQVQIIDHMLSGLIYSSISMEVVRG